MDSSSMAPTPPPQPRDYSRRGISPEPRFDPLTFKDKNYCANAIETIENTDLSVFTRLPRVFCPRLVRQFYESLHATCDLETAEWRGQFMIDGTVYHFTSYDIAKALGLKDYKPLPYDELNELEMRLELSFRPPPANSRPVLRESHLHHNFWVVHKFMRACASPHTHDNEVPQYLYKYWHGMYTERVIDIPALMVENMLVSRDGGRVTLSPHNLAMPRSIMAILKGLKYKFSKAELREEVVEIFNYERCKKSLDTLATQVKLKLPVKARKGRKESRGQEQVPEREGEDHMDTGAGGQSSNAPPHPEPQNHYDQMMAMMQGFGSTLAGIQHTVEGYGATFQGFDTRIQGLETAVGSMQAQLGDFISKNEPSECPPKVYQRKHRKHTISIEEDDTMEK